MYPGCHQIHIQIAIHINHYFTRKDGVQAETVSVPQLVSEKILTQLRQLMWAHLYPRRTFASESWDFPSPFRGNWNQKVECKGGFPLGGKLISVFYWKCQPNLVYFNRATKEPLKEHGLWNKYYLVCKNPSILCKQYNLGIVVCQGCILSPCLFNLYAEYIMRNAGLEETQTGIKIAGRNINNLNQ